MKIYTFNDKVLTRNSRWLKEYEEPTPPTPSLPPYTIRLRFTDGNQPNPFPNGTAVQVSSSPNIWDITYENSDWTDMCGYQYFLEEIIAANITGVTGMQNLFSDSPNLQSVPLFDISSATNVRGMFKNCDILSSVPLFNTSNVANMSSMFENCGSLTSVPLFNTSNVTTMNSMLSGCGSLTAVPLFDTSKVTDMRYMLNHCYKVESGALALYQQASSQTTPPSYYSYTFRDCGRDTATGAAELAQIPASWGGTMA